MKTRPASLNNFRFGLRLVLLATPTAFAASNVRYPAAPVLPEFSS